MTATLGGFRIVSVSFTGPVSLKVTLVTEYTDRYFQLYAGRRLIGVTESTGETTINGQLQPAHCPHCLTVVMVEEGEQGTDFGDALPGRPYNQVRMNWSAEDFPADAKWFVLRMSSVAGGTVDQDNVIARMPYQGDGEYTFLFPPVTEYGDWSFEITPVDDAATEGNAGDASTVSQYVLPFPPDVGIRSDGSRLRAEQVDATLHISFDYDW